MRGGKKENKLQSLLSKRFVLYQFVFLVEVLVIVFFNQLG